MRSYKDLIAWQRAMDLAEVVYGATASFPTEERFGLTSQARRAATSIPSNLAEGSARLTTRDWQHFLSQARGSVCELETQLLLAARLHLGDPARVACALDLAQEVGRIINGLLNSTRTRQPRRCSPRFDREQTAPRWICLPTPWPLATDHWPLTTDHYFPSISLFTNSKIIFCMWRRSAGMLTP
ncbi:MAG: four helix bundle protein [Thermoanaerobaculia bacterium]